MVQSSAWRCAGWYFDAFQQQSKKGAEHCRFKLSPGNSQRATIGGEGCDIPHSAYAALAGIENSEVRISAQFAGYAVACVLAVNLRNISMQAKRGSERGRKLPIITLAGVAKWQTHGT